MKKLITMLALFIVSVSAGIASASGAYAPVVNKSNPGMTYNIKKDIVPGKIVIFDFYSKYCGPCVRIAPLLVKLDRKRADIVVRKLNIDRKGAKGMDFRSPLARQYKLRFIPYFIIFNKKGQVTHNGQNATRRVLQYMKESGISLK